MSTDIGSLPRRQLYTVATAYTHASTGVSHVLPVTPFSICLVSTLALVPTAFLGSRPPEKQVILVGSDNCEAITTVNHLQKKRNKLKIPKVCLSPLYGEGEGTGA